MSNNFNSDNKLRVHYATFQSKSHAHVVPPPPTPPPFFIFPPPSLERPDQDTVTSFEDKIPAKQAESTATNKPILISEAREKFHELILAVNNLKEKEKMLTENISALTEDEWRSNINEIEETKLLITSILGHINGDYLNLLRKLLAKRVAKRLRKKRVRLESIKEYEERKKEMEEKSRKIDENLQKIKDDINKAKQEQEDKLEADMVLKEVRRKKVDAKKCIVKLDALVELRKARQDTAKGRGETVSEGETAAFHKSIDKLKSMWTRQLASYEVEETELRAKLKEDSPHLDTHTNVTEKEVAGNLEKWREVMFGGQLPQSDFKGDIDRFISVRSQWDRYISSEGSTLPVGWLSPEGNE